MKIVVLELMRHERMMPYHGPVEGATEELGPLLDVRGKRNEVFRCDKMQLSTDRLIDQYLRLERVDLSHQIDVEKVYSHSPGPIRRLSRRPGFGYSTHPKVEKYPSWTAMTGS